jgi:hypothetical protein
MTSPTLELPPLPEESYRVWDDIYDGWQVTGDFPHDRFENLRLWNEEQMRSYALEVRRQALEEAAKVCENGRSKPYQREGQPEIVLSHLSVTDETLTMAAAAIRALK